MTDPLCIITEAGLAAGLRALDRYHRDVARRTITLPETEYRELPDGWQDIPKGWTPQGGSPAMPKEWV